MAAPSSSTSPLLGTGHGNSRRGSTASLAKQPSYKVKDDAGGHGEDNKCNELIFKLLAHIMFVLAFSPIFIGLFIADKRIALTGAMVASLFSNIYAFVLYKLGRTVSWPKPLDLILFTLFLAQTLCIWIWPEGLNFWLMWAATIFGFGMAFGVAFVWFILGLPFTRPFVEDEYGKIGATHPFCRFEIRVTCTVFLVAFSIIGVLGLPVGITQSLGKPSETAMMVASIGEGVVLLSAFVISFPGLDRFMKKYEADIFEKYKVEIMEWMEKYPDEKFTIMAKEEMAKEAEEAGGNMTL